MFHVAEKEFGEVDIVSLISSHPPSKHKLMIAPGLPRRRSLRAALVQLLASTRDVLLQRRTARLTQHRSRPLRDAGHQHNTPDPHHTTRTNPLALAFATTSLALEPETHRTHLQRRRTGVRLRRPAVLRLETRHQRLHPLAGPARATRCARQWRCAWSDQDAAVD